MIGPKLCECGCGSPTPIAQQTDRRRGLVAGQPGSFIRGHAGSMQARVARQVRAGRPAEPRRVRAQHVAHPAELYAEELLHRSKLIVGAVRDHGPDELLRQIDLALAMEQPDGIDPAVALITVLAGQIDPDTTDEQRLGWVRQFGAPQQIQPSGQLPLRASPPRKETAA